jgi:hypothetical protein
VVNYRYGAEYLSLSFLALEKDMNKRIDRREAIVFQKKISVLYSAYQPMFSGLHK